MESAHTRFPPVGQKYSVQGGDSSVLDDVELESNPFILPKEDVFLLREREKQQKAEARSRLATQKIWEKSSSPSTYSSRQESRSAYLAAALNSSGSGVAARAGDGRSGPTAAANSAEGSKTQYPASMLQLQAQEMKQNKIIMNNRRREKENMSDFIAKKRDMFLIQMSLDTKRQEINKLEEKAQMKEEALRRSEQMLEEDAMRFDTFLKENDRKAHDALKRADLETKEKQEKVLEIKKLNAEISKVENEMSKYEEQLQACLKYKEFLDSLTPPEWLEKVRQQKEEKRRARAAQGNKPKHDDGLVDDDDSDDDVEPMYFEKPEQLLDIFAQLEERNLFLIQNVQETEEALEELKQKFEQTEKEMEEKTSLLHANIADLKQKIAIENEKSETLKRRAYVNSVAGSQQRLLTGLQEKVKQVYTRCGFDAETQTETLDMLREIEGWLERLLLEIKNMDPVKVEQAEKKKNAERRNQIRQIKKEEQKRLYEERLAKSTARAKAEVIRQSGKQMMFRSPPIRKKKKKEDVVQRDEEAEELKRFFT